MYTKGTQTVQPKNEDFVPPPHTLTDTPTKSHPSHLSTPPHHQQKKIISSEKINESEDVNEKLEGTNEREQEVISIVEPTRIVLFAYYFCFSSFTVLLIDYFCVCINSKIYRRFGSREYERREC